MLTPKAAFEELSLRFNALQQQLNKHVADRQQLETQLQENKIVLEEFAALEEDAKIYKLTGPVLMPQDAEEAKMNVSTRLEFIQGEIDKVERSVKLVQEEMELTRGQLVELRAKAQAA